MVGSRQLLNAFSPIYQIRRPRFRRRPWATVLGRHLMTRGGSRGYVCPAGPSTGSAGLRGLTEISATASVPGWADSAAQDRPSTDSVYVRTDNGVCTCAADSVCTDGEACMCANSVHTDHSACMCADGVQLTNNSACVHADSVSTVWTVCVLIDSVCSDNDVRKDGVHVTACAVTTTCMDGVHLTACALSTVCIRTACILMACAAHFPVCLPHTCC
eukprot:Opistho-2@92057